MQCSRPFANHNLQWATKNSPTIIIRLLQRAKTTTIKILFAKQNTIIVGSMTIKYEDYVVRLGDSCNKSREGPSGKCESRKHDICKRDH